MEYRDFGRTGVKVSPLCLGCMRFGQKTSLEDTCRIIDRALESGINFLDTSNNYTRGRSEEFIGEALKRNGKRDRVVLATKVFGRMNDEDPNAGGNSRRHIIEQCHQSLKRLQTDHIDLYQIHRPMAGIPIDETLRALDDLVRAGKVRYIGTSAFGAWQCVEALWTSERLGLNRFICEQPSYSILDRRAERELFSMARTYGYAVIPYSPLYGGLLTGKYRRNEDPPADTRFGAVKKEDISAAVFDVCDALAILAEKHSATISQVALAWNLTNPAVTAPIIGPRTLEQFEDNLGALTVKLDAEDLAVIDTLVRPGEVVLDPFEETIFAPHPHRI